MHRRWDRCGQLLRCDTFYSYLLIEHTYASNLLLLVEGAWSTWGTWSSCPGGQSGISRVRSHTGGNPPCSGSDTETKSFGTPCCLNPVLSISYQEQTPFFKSMTVAFSDSHQTLYVVHGRAKPVLRGPNSTELKPVPSWRNHIHG